MWRSSDVTLLPPIPAPDAVVSASDSPQSVPSMAGTSCEPSPELVGPSVFPVDSKSLFSARRALFQGKKDDEDKQNCGSPRVSPTVVNITATKTNWDDDDDNYKTTVIDRLDKLSASWSPSPTSSSTEGYYGSDGSDVTQQEIELEVEGEEEEATTAASATSSQATSIPTWNLTNKDHQKLGTATATTTTTTTSTTGQHHHHEVEVPLSHYYWMSSESGAPYLLSPPSSLTAASSRRGRRGHPWKQQQHRWSYAAGSDTNRLPSQFQSLGQSDYNKTEPMLLLEEPIRSLSTDQKLGPMESSNEKRVMVFMTDDEEIEFCTSPPQSPKTTHSSQESQPYQKEGAAPAAPSRITIVIEDPPPEASSASCNSGLNMTPKQLAELFLACSQTTTLSRHQKQKQRSSQHATNTNALSSSPLSPTSSTSSLPPPVGRVSIPKSDCSIVTESSHPNDDVDDDNDLLRSNKSMPHGPMAFSNVDDGDKNTTYNNENWMSRALFLERECAALKKIVEQDATSVLNLQRAIETQKQLNSLKEMEIVDNQTELQISEERISRLKKDREDYLEREMEQLETIRILKYEVDKLTLNRPSPTDEVASSTYERIEFERLERELSLSSAQLLEQRVQIADLERTVKQQKEVNQYLQTEIDWLKHQQHMQSTVTEIYTEFVGASVDNDGVEQEICQSIDPMMDSSPLVTDTLAARESDPTLPSSLLILVDKLDDLSGRLAALESQNSMEQGYASTLELKGNNITAADRESVIIQNGFTAVKVSNNPEEIEAVPAQKKDDTCPSRIVQMFWCCD